MVHASGASGASGGDGVAAADSLRAVERALSLDEAMRSRTEGLTWMIWGFVLAAIFLMYAAMGGLSEPDGPPWWSALLWVPWVLVGGLFTWTLWRTAGLAFALPRTRPAGALVTLAWVASILAGFALLQLLPGAPNPESSPLLAVGLAWLLMGALGLFRTTPEGRRTLLGIGALTFAAGTVLVLALPTPPYGTPGEDAARFAQDLLRAAVAGGVPVAAGLWQALRG